MRLLRVVGSICILTFFGVLLFIAWSHRDDYAKYQHDITAWKAKSEQISKLNDQLQKKVDSIVISSDSAKITAIRQSNEIVRLRSIASVSRTDNDKKLVDITRTLPDTCKGAIELAKAYRAEADTLQKALDVAEQRDSVRVEDINRLRIGISLEKQVNDSLTKLILTVPVYKPSVSLGSISFPSRKTSFIVGLVVGMVGGYYVQHVVR